MNLNNEEELKIFVDSTFEEAYSIELDPNRSEELLEVAIKFQKIVEVYTKQSDLCLRNSKEWNALYANVHQMQYEYHMSMCGYYSAMKEYEKAIEELDIAIKELSDAVKKLKIARSLFVSKEQIDAYNYDINRWSYFVESSKLNRKIIAGNKENYYGRDREAIELYETALNEFIKLEELVEKNIKDGVLELFFRRMVKSNTLKASSNLSGSLGKLILSSSAKYDNDFKIDALIKIWNSYLLSKESTIEFPESSHSAIVAKNQKSNFICLLKKNKKIWKDVLVKCESNELKKIMVDIDTRVVKSMESNDNYGVFTHVMLWGGIIALLMVVLVFTYANLGIIPTIVIVIALLLLVITLSTLAMKSNGSLNEDNFSKILISVIENLNVFKNSSE